MAQVVVVNRPEKKIVQMSEGDSKVKAILLKRSIVYVLCKLLRYASEEGNIIVSPRKAQK